MADRKRKSDFIYRKRDDYENSERGFWLRFRRDEFLRVQEPFRRGVELKQGWKEGAWHWRKQGFQISFYSEHD